MYCTGINTTPCTVQGSTLHHVLYRDQHHTMYCTGINTTPCPVQGSTSHHVLYRDQHHTMFCTRTNNTLGRYVSTKAFSFKLASQQLRGLLSELPVILHYLYLYIHVRIPIGDSTFGHLRSKGLNGHNSCTPPPFGQYISPCTDQKRDTTIICNVDTITVTYLLTHVRIYANVHMISTNSLVWRLGPR